jgi:hypothetical protein
MAMPRTGRVNGTRQKQPQSKNRITPICGWFSGNARRQNPSVFSFNTRASRCRPSSPYVIARLPIAPPESERVNDFNVTPQLNSSNSIAPISGWFSGKTRCKNSSVLSRNSRASWCSPSSPYVTAREFIALPGTERDNVKKSNQQTQSYHTYVRMVLRQHTTQKLKRLLLQRQSILMPLKITVRDGKIVHCDS